MEKESLSDLTKGFSLIVMGKKGMGLEYKFFIQIEASDILGM